MDSFLEGIQSVADSDEMVVDFANFCNEIHNKIGCKRGKNCKLNLFVSPLLDFSKKTSL